jgi:hypothetical protein
VGECDLRLDKSCEHASANKQGKSESARDGDGEISNRQLVPIVNNKTQRDNVRPCAEIVVDRVSYQQRYFPK